MLYIGIVHWHDPETGKMWVTTKEVLAVNEYIAEQALRTWINLTEGLPLTMVIDSVNIDLKGGEHFVPNTKLLSDKTVEKQSL